MHFPQTSFGNNGMHIQQSHSQTDQMKDSAYTSSYPATSFGPYGQSYGSGRCPSNTTSTNETRARSVRRGATTVMNKMNETNFTLGHPLERAEPQPKRKRIDVEGEAAQGDEKRRR